jgi:ATP-dependent Clp protease adaptor protein ClpS
MSTEREAPELPNSPLRRLTKTGAAPAWDRPTGAMPAAPDPLAGRRWPTHIVNVILPGFRRRQSSFQGIPNFRAMLHPSSLPEPDAAPTPSGAGLGRKAARMSKNNDDNRGRSGPGTSVITKVKPKPKRPNLYRVLILNDDYTPMEFVVHVLEKFFNKDVEAATKIMLHVHHHGIGECGVFTYEIAETKVTQVMDFARKHQHPLQCVMEKK